jgi:hypothetical protein
MIIPGNPLSQQHTARDIAAPATLAPEELRATPPR